MHGATIIGRICSEHSKMREAIIIGRLCSEHQRMTDQLLDVYRV